MATHSKQLSTAQQNQLLTTLQTRFETNMHRHPGVEWSKVVEKLASHPEKLCSLAQMETTGGEPDVVCMEPSADYLTFVDCAPESPTGRRSLCYDLAAWESRKQNKPTGNVMSMAEEMGMTLINEQQYNVLQQLGDFDRKTSSWIATPENIRRLGGALFADSRYGHVFVYHNGAESYYASRGFRGMLRV